MVSKTNVTQRDKGAQRVHFCPECGARSKMVQHRPGRAMWGHCEKGHAFPKNELVLGLPTRDGGN